MNQVLKCIRDLVKDSNGNLSVVLSIHQPNSSILELFDHLLILERGTSAFFGTIPEASAYFQRIGFTCPVGVTPTDYFLQISDSNFKYVQDFDFEKAFKSSDENKVVIKRLADHGTYCDANKTVVTSGKNDVSFWVQFYVLLKREYTLAARDPTLYYLQFVMIYFFAFLIGVVFWDLPYRVDGQSFSIVIAGSIWFAMMNGTVHIFKVYYLSAFNRRIQHEMANNSYGALSISLAESIATMTLTVGFLPSVPLLYFMMGFPPEGFPFLLLLCWVVSINMHQTLFPL